MSEPKPDLPVRPISELVADPEFPGNSVGQKVDIDGYSGEIVGIVKNSIKVRSAEGGTMSYNYHTLRKLYGPRVTPVAQAEEPAPAPPAPPPEPKRQIILEPNFDAPLVPIETLVSQPDFPQCAFGVHVDLRGGTSSPRYMRP